MKIAGIFVGVAGVILAARAFSDTAPLYYVPLEAGSAKPFHQHYIAEASDVLAQIERFSDSVCSANERVVVYRVRRLVGRLDALSILNVHYASKPVSMLFGESCATAGADALVSVIEVDDDSDHHVLEFLAQQQQAHVFVQGVPHFHSALQDVKDYVKDKLDIQVFHKRAASPELESWGREDLSRLEKEVELEFEAAEKLVLGGVDAAEDGPVRTSLNRTVPRRDSNLFTNYQFFTPGIWMCAIVSGLMIGVLYVALGWISSVEISYGAFDKQVDWQKKNE